MDIQALPALPEGCVLARFDCKQPPLRRRNAAPSALELSVLVLNKHYAPIHVTTARRAFVLLYKRFAEAISVDRTGFAAFDLDAWLRFEPDMGEVCDDDDFVQAVTRPVRVPRVVRLVAYDRFPRACVQFTRRNVLARDEFRCQYCDRAPGSRELTLDHVVPRSRGGRHCWTNVVACCRRCNHRKGPRMLHEAGMKLRQSPVAPKRNPILHRRLRQRKYRAWQLFIRI